MKEITIKDLKKDRLLRPDQVAAILQVNKKTVYNRVSEGHFSIVTTGGSLRIWENSVYLYLKRLTQVADYEHKILEKT